MKGKTEGKDKRVKGWKYNRITGIIENYKLIIKWKSKRINIGKL